MSNTVTIYNSYFIVNNEIMENNISDKKICDLPSGCLIFAVMTYNNRPLKLVDVSNFIARIPNIDTSLTIYQALVTYMTDLIYDSYGDKSTYKQHTLNIFDPLRVSRMDVTQGNCDEISTWDNEERKPFARDLIITLDGTVNPSNCIASINGVIHKTLNLGNNKLGVIDGYVNFRRSTRKSILIINTDDLGGHDIIDLTSSNMTAISDVDNKLYITYENRKFLKDYTLFLSIDGTLRTPLHKCYKVINDTTIVIDLDNIDFIRQLRHNPNLLPYQSKPTLNIKTPYPSVINDPDMNIFRDSRITDTSPLLTKDFIKRRMTSSQSFIIAVRNTKLFLNRRDLTAHHDPRRYCYFGSTIPNGIFYFNDIHQIPYTLIQNKVIEPLNVRIKEELSEVFLRPFYAFYINAYKGGDDINNHTYNSDKIPCLYSDIDHYYSPLSYLIEVSSFS